MGSRVLVRYAGELKRNDDRGIRWPPVVPRPRDAAPVVNGGPPDHQPLPSGGSSRQIAPMLPVRLPSTRIAMGAWGGETNSETGEQGA